jgi:endoglucanase
MKAFCLLLLFPVCCLAQANEYWIRVNQLGYIPNGKKVAVFCGKGSTNQKAGKNWKLVDLATGKPIASGSLGRDYGEYGPYNVTYRLDFSFIKRTGHYYLVVDTTRSPVIIIGPDVYKGAADFCLNYMRQQRSGFNPFLRDSCHTHDGYTLYGGKVGLGDSTEIDAVGGWHDASDYLQYSATSANAVYHLMMAYRDFPTQFTDTKLSNGLDGKNGLADVMDEANWGLQWMLKMHPRFDWMFNQVGDDRDHQGMRIPKEDSFYGKGFQRPVYFIDGEVQQRGRFLNHTTGTSSTAGKFAAAFALAHIIYNSDSSFHLYARKGGYYEKAISAFQFGLRKPGVTQTVSVRSPYIYAEDNWTDDMELAAVLIHRMLNANTGSSDNGYYLARAVDYAKMEKITPWLGADTANHYEWYPFINLGHGELLLELKSGKFFPQRDAGFVKEFVDGFARNLDTIGGYYKEGIARVAEKAIKNAFLRGIPFIWCSNNLTVAFTIQCYWYRRETGDEQYAELEQSNFDWLFGCNPWGTSMVYGLPAWADTPTDPHSALTHIGHYSINGGLVDGPVYGSIYNNLTGIKLYNTDAYALFQSNLAVYHDDYGDYSTNEPTMDGTASLIYLLAARSAEAKRTEANPH